MIKVWSTSPAGDQRLYAVRSPSQEEAVAEATAHAAEAGWPNVVIPIALLDDTGTFFLLLERTPEPGSDSKSTTPPRSRKRAGKAEVATETRRAGAISKAGI